MVTARRRNETTSWRPCSEKMGRFGGSGQAGKRRHARWRSSSPPSCRGSRSVCESHEFRKNRLATGLCCWESPRHPWLYHVPCHSPCRQRETRPSPSGRARRWLRSRSPSAARMMAGFICRRRTVQISGGGRSRAWRRTGRSRAPSSPTSQRAARGSSNRRGWSRPATPLRRGRQSVSGLSSGSRPQRMASG